MKCLYALILIATLGTTQIQAQEETVFNHYGGIQLTGLWGGWNNSLADFKDDFNLNTGGFFTFEINNSLLIGWSGYKSDNMNNGRELEIKGNDLLLGYVFHNDRVIHPLVYVQMGSSSLDIQDVGTDRVFVAQPTVGAELNVTRFFRIGLEGGYRFFSNSDIQGFSDKDFSSPVLGLRFKFGWSWD